MLLAASRGNTQLLASNSDCWVAPANFLPQLMWLLSDAGINPFCLSESAIFNLFSFGPHVSWWRDSCCTSRQPMLSSRKKGTGRGLCQLSQIIGVGEAKYCRKASLGRLAYMSKARNGVRGHSQSNTGHGEWGHFHWLRPITVYPLALV